MNIASVLYNYYFIPITLLNASSRLFDLHPLSPIYKVYRCTFTELTVYLNIYYTLKWPTFET